MLVEIKDLEVKLVGIIGLLLIVRPSVEMSDFLPRKMDFPLDENGFSWV